MNSGYITAGIIYLSLNSLFPPPGLGEMVYMDSNGEATIEDVAESDSVGSEVVSGEKEIGGASLKALEA